MKPKMIVLAGPTAVGKTAVSIALAHRLNGSVISADSMQVYRQMDIGTAKIRPEERENIPHYLIDVKDPSEEFSVVDFQQMAREAVREIYSQGRIPIVVGGTGFYIQALLYDVAFEEAGQNSQLREKWEQFAREFGVQALHSRLMEVDPESAKAIHPNNSKRVVRALEFYDATHTPISAHNKAQRERESPYDFRYFVLTRERSALYAQIDRRVDEMLAQGLVEEVRALQAQGCRRDMVSMQGLGYKEMLAYLDGECSLDTAVEQLKQNTRHFAKRQLTWFRRERDVIWLDRQQYPDTPSLMEKIERQLW